jgi:hypothetical protein
MQARSLFEIAFYSCLVVFAVAQLVDYCQGKRARQEERVLVLNVCGQVETVSPDHELVLWRPAVQGECLRHGASIATGDSQSYADLLLSDNTLLHLDGNSFVEVKASDHNILVKSGSVTISHATRSTGPIPYRLFTARSLVSASGESRLVSDPVAAGPIAGNEPSRPGDSSTRNHRIVVRSLPTY